MTFDQSVIHLKCTMIHSEYDSGLCSNNIVINKTQTNKHQVPQLLGVYSDKMHDVSLLFSK